MTVTTIAEDLVLLLLDPESGRALVDRTSFDRAVGGALLLDLTVIGRITADGDGARARLTVTDAGTTGDPLLDDALGRLSGRPIRAARAVEKLARKTRRPVLERLAERGVVVREDEKVLGLFPTTRWHTGDPRPRASLQAGIAAVLLGKAEPNERQAGLVSLLHAVKAEHKIVDGPKRELRERARAISDGEWAGVAVRKAVQAVQATIMVAVAASSSTAAGG